MTGVIILAQFSHKGDQIITVSRISGASDSLTSRISLWSFSRDNLQSAQTETDAAKEWFEAPFVVSQVTTDTAGQVVVATGSVRTDQGTRGRILIRRWNDATGTFQGGEGFLDEESQPLTCVAVTGTGIRGECRGMDGVNNAVPPIRISECISL